jgi:hypothetical protein
MRHGQYRDGFGDDPTMMGAWNEDPPRYQPSPAAEARAAVRAAEQAAFVARERAAAAERMSRRERMEHICAYCGRPHHSCGCWS